MSAKESRAIELEGTIYVTHAQAEDEHYQHLPAPRVEFTHPGILAPNTIPQHSIVSIDQREEALQIVNIKLAIGIHKEGQFLRNRSKTTDQGRAVALILGVVNQADARIIGDKRLDNFARPVFTTIVNDNNLKILCPCRHSITHRAYRLAYSHFFIVG